MSSYLLPPASYLLSPTSYLLSPTFYFLSPTSHLTPHSMLIQVATLRLEVALSIEPLLQLV